MLVSLTTKESGYLCLFSVLSSTLCLLQDEDEEIRFNAAEFVAMIAEPTKSLTCSAAMERVFQFMADHVWSIPGCWMIMETMIRGSKSTAEVLKDYLGARYDNLNIFNIYYIYF